jgi:hypothetical protein
MYSRFDALDGPERSSIISSLPSSGRTPKEGQRFAGMTRYWRRRTGLLDITTSDDGKVVEERRASGGAESQRKGFQNALFWFKILHEETSASIETSRRWEPHFVFGDWSVLSLPSQTSADHLQVLRTVHLFISLSSTSIPLRRPARPTLVSHPRCRSRSPRSRSLDLRTPLWFQLPAFFCRQTLKHRLSGGLVCCIAAPRDRV